MFALFLYLDQFQKNHYFLLTPEGRYLKEFLCAGSTQNRFYLIVSTDVKHLGFEEKYHFFEQGIKRVDYIRLSSVLIL